MSLESQISQAFIKQDRLVEERSALEKKVVMMRPGSIDRDLLEERVRFVLGYHKPNEVVLRQDSL